MKNHPAISCFKSFKVLGLSALFGAAALLSAVEVSAHGYISNPKSRILLCKENGSSPACVAAAAVGNAGIYEPQSINIGGADNNHQQLIPDGKLCSAGKQGFGGIDLARNDWIATPVSAGPRTFTWTNTAAHRSAYFRYYITKQGFNPSSPLRWSDLEQIHQSAPAGQETVSNHVVNLPARTGRHIVYSVWQRDRSDAPEGFYQCVDVIYGGPTPSSVSSTAPSSRSTNPSSSSVIDTCANLPTWNATTQYNNPTQVQHNGKRYSANYWTQGNNPEQTSGQYNYWLDLGVCGNSSTGSSVTVPSSRSSSSVTVPRSSSPSSAVSGNCTSPAFVSGTSYTNGSLVQNGGSEYRCTVAGWCSVGGPYAPGSGWAWTNAWSLVRSCQ